MDAATELAQVQRLPSKTSPTPVSPARALALGNVYKQSKETTPHNLDDSLNVVTLKSVRYADTTSDGRVVYQRYPRNVRITAPVLNNMSEDKLTGGKPHSPYATSDFPSTTRVEVTLPRVSVPEAIDSPTFQRKLEAMMRDPAQSHINPERGDLKQMQKQQEKRRSTRYGERSPSYQRMLFMSSLKRTMERPCGTCTHRERYKICTGLAKKVQHLTAKEQEEEDKELLAEDYPTTNIDDSDESSESSISTDGDSEADEEDDEEWDDYVLVEGAELTAEEQRERKRHALRTAAARERSLLQVHSHERELEAVKQRTRYTQMLVRGAAGCQAKVAFERTLGTWW